MKVSDLKGYTVVSSGKPTTPQSTPTTPSAPQEDRSLADRATDFAGGAVYGISAPGRVVQNLLSKGVEKVTGVQGFGEATKDGFEKATTTDVDTTSGKVGQFVGETALSAIPGGQASKATAGLSLAKRALTQGATQATVQAAKTGDIGKDEAVAFVFGAASEPVGDVLSAASRSLSTKFPEWLVKPLIKQAKDAKVAGKDIAPYLVKTGRVGSVDSLISQTQTAIDDVSARVASSLANSTKAGVQVPRTQIIDDVVQQINNNGGAVAADDVLGIVDNLAPQARGILAKENLTLEEANKLRALIDKTLGDRAFVGAQLPFNKDVLRRFTNSLRETVKAQGDDTLRADFDEYAKNITLRDALVDRASSGGGANSVGLYDLMAGGGALAFTGDPATAVGAAVTRRIFESAVFKTSLAKAFSNTDKLVTALEKTTPASRAVILQFIDEITDEDGAIDTQTPPPTP